MEAQMNQPMLAPQRFMSGILKKTFSIPGENKKVMVSTTLLVVFPFCLLILGADLTFVCVMVKMLTTIEVLMEKDIGGPEAKKLVQGIIESVWFLLGVQVLMMALFCVVSAVCLVVTGVNFKNCFSKMGGQWRIRRVITWFHVMVFVVVIDVMILISVGLLSVGDIDVALIVLGLMFVVVGTLCCVCLAAIWMFSIVMSIKEMHTSELAVFEKSDELIEGRRLQGFVLMVFASILSIAVVVACAFEARKDGRGLDARFEKGIMILCYVSLVKIFMFVLYSVYCLESKRRYGEQVDAEEGSGYSLIPTSEV